MTVETGRGELERLRELLLDDDRRRLQASLDRLAIVEQAQRNLPERLPGLLYRAAEGDGAERMGEALAGPVAGALATAIRSNRRVLIDVLFPIVGPTIRKAIAESMRNLVGEINAALVSSFSLRGLRWRLESWRSGVPYSKVVLRHTLSYEIDHVFLIEPESGLLMFHGHGADTAALDGDAIAGMLTAIGDFVRDSVDRDGDGRLESARVGEYQLELNSGPRATLACFVRGVPPRRFHDVLSEIVEELHDNGGDEAQVQTWVGANRERLQPDAIQQRIGQPVSKGRASSMWPLLLIALVALGLLFWQVLRVERWQQRVDQVRAALVAHPGFVLIALDSKPWSRLRIQGLLDPDAAALAPQLAGIDLAGVQPTLDIEGYISADDALIQQRALRILQPPDGVQLTVDQRLLRLSGRADADWITRAKANAALIAGVAGTEIALNRSRSDLQKLAEQLSLRRIIFGEATIPRHDPQLELDRMAAELVDATALARELSLQLRVRVLGDNDQVGGDAINLRVREQRRDWLAAALIQRQVPAALLDVRGLGTTAERGARLQVEIME